jgi:hypothetical protein
MAPADNHEERKVQQAMALLKNNPKMKAKKAAAEMRASYLRLLRRLKGIARSSSRGGHNKKLTEVNDNVLKDYLLMCHGMGRAVNVEHTIAACNSILRAEGRVEETVSRRWVKKWLSRNSEWLKTLRETPLSAARRGSHNKEEVEGHFTDFKRCREK